MGVYVILKEGALPDDDPQDTGVLTEGVEVALRRLVLCYLG